MPCIIHAYDNIIMSVKGRYVCTYTLIQTQTQPKPKPTHVMHTHTYTHTHTHTLTYTHTCTHFIAWKHPTDSIFDTNNLLSHAICPSLCRYGLVINTEDRE